MFACYWLLNFLSLKSGHGIFNGLCDLSACCAHEGKTGAYKSAQMWAGQNWKKQSFTVLQSGVEPGTLEFTIQHVSQPATNSHSLSTTAWILIPATSPSGATQCLASHSTQSSRNQKRKTLWQKPLPVSPPPPAPLPSWTDAGSHLGSTLTGSVIRKEQKHTIHHGSFAQHRHRLNSDWFCHMLKNKNTQCTMAFSY